jgi:hypothetical protein
VGPPTPRLSSAIFSADAAPAKARISAGERSSAKRANCMSRDDIFLLR